MTRRYGFMLLVLAAIWGASFMFIKVAVRELEPMALVWLRLLLAGVVLVPAALLTVGRDAVTQFRAAFGRLAVMGMVNSALPFLLLAWAETRLDAGLAAILQAAAPLFTAVISLRFGTDRVTGARLAGVVLGFVGVALLVGAHTGGDLVAALAVVGTALCYSAAGVYGAHKLRDTHPFVVGAGSMVIALVLVAPFGLAALPAHMIGAKELGSVLVLGLVCTGVAYMLFFVMLRGAGASRSILVTYLVPGTALVYAVVLLGEHVRVTAFLGLMLILGGVALGARRRKAVVAA
jgi:drug/metabolite transporter (DMT)-like permease